MREAGINFFIHDLNPYGGQDRSTLEILRELSLKMPVHVYAYSFQNPGNSGSNIVFHRCPFRVRRPVLLKSILFHAWSLWVAATDEPRLTLTTGACSLVGDIVHVQFIARAWQREKDKVTVLRRWPSRLYHRALAAYNIWMENRFFTNERRYAAISESVAGDLRSEFGLERISVIRHGVDTAQFAPAASAESKSELRRRLGLPASSPVFLFVGAYDRKGLATLVLAAKRVRTAHDVTVVAVGSGDGKAYTRLAGDDSAHDWLILRAGSRNIEDYYRAADYFVLPTLYEPFGLVVLEAMSAGLPVIVSRIAGAAELIRNGENGFLLEDATSAEELAGKMRFLLENRELAARLSGEARITAETRPWPRVAQEFGELLGQAAERRP